MTPRPQDVERGAKQYFVPGKMFVVVVGAKQKIEAGLQGLTQGKVQLTSFDPTPATASAAAGASSTI